LNTKPITVGLYGAQVYWPLPFFDNVHNYYLGGLVKNETDTLISVRPKSIIINRAKLTATITGISALVGDYILGSPTNVTGWHYDSAMNHARSPTLQIGRVVAVRRDSLYLDDVGLNVFPGSPYDAIYLDRVK
jgi:hypothetical protein